MLGILNSVGGNEGARWTQDPELGLKTNFKISGEEKKVQINSQPQGRREILSSAEAQYYLPDPTAKNRRLK
eukprot:11317313-Ditylum_brightwellii.AAC.2